MKIPFHRDKWWQIEVTEMLLSPTMNVSMCASVVNAIIVCASFANVWESRVTDDRDTGLIDPADSLSNKFRTLKPYFTIDQLRL